MTVDAAAIRSRLRGHISKFLTHFKSKKLFFCYLPYDLCINSSSVIHYFRHSNLHHLSFHSSSSPPLRSFRFCFLSYLVLNNFTIPVIFFFLFFYSFILSFYHFFPSLPGNCCLGTEKLFRLLPTSTEL